MGDSSVGAKIKYYGLILLFIFVYSIGIIAVLAHLNKQQTGFEYLGGQIMSIGGSFLAKTSGLFSI